MTYDHQRITELDLMALADGRLDALRRRAVEAHLARDPEARAFVEAIIEQNDMLREVLAPIGAESVPRRLQAVLEARPPSRARRAMLQAASILGLAILSGAGGWWLGANHASPIAAAPPSFLAGLATDPEPTSVIARLGPLGEPAADVGGLPDSGVVTTAAPWFTERVTVELQAPALGARFASPELQRLVEIDGRPTVRFELAGPDGRAMALYLQTRPSTAAPDIHLVDTPTGSTAYWQDGPLLWALTGALDGGDLEPLARNIGTAIELVPRLGTIQAEHTGHTALPVVPQMTMAGG